MRQEPLVAVRDAQKNGALPLARWRRKEVCSDQRLPDRVACAGADPDHLAGALHEWPERWIHTTQLCGAECWRLHRNAGRRRFHAGAVAGARQRVAERNVHRERHHWDSSHLAHEGHGATGAWVHLNQVDPLLAHDELRVHQTADADLAYEAREDLGDLRLARCRDALRRIDGD